MKDWAVILGASSGFGAAACRELASYGINIYGVHLDRKTTMNAVNSTGVFLGCKSVIPVMKKSSPDITIFTLSW